MTAEQIIEEIKRLDPKDQLGVIRFAYQLDAERKLTGKELSSLATRMTETDDPAEAAMIRESIVRGFYGPWQRQLTAQHYRRLRGSLKGTKAMDVFMSERKREREL